MAKNDTVWSNQFAGDDTNYDLWVQFDLTDGYLGLSQGQKDYTKVDARILLTPAQVELLKAFLDNPKRMRKKL
jgi:hypothetical protein